MMHARCTNEMNKFAQFCGNVMLYTPEWKQCIAPHKKDFSRLCWQGIVAAEHCHAYHHGRVEPLIGAMKIGRQVLNPQVVRSKKDAMAKSGAHNQTKTKWWIYCASGIMAGVCVAALCVGHYRRKTSADVGKLESLVNDIDMFNANYASPEAIAYTPNTNSIQIV